MFLNMADKPKAPVKNSSKYIKVYSQDEEIFNAVTHGVGAALSVLGLILMVVKSAAFGSALYVASTAVFGISMVLLYTLSTLYHSIKQERAKQVFKILDHSSIFLLIAGTYTPFTLLVLRGAWGWSIFGVVWGLAVTGIIIESIFINKLKFLTLILYLSMGWVVIVALKPLIRSMPKVALYWLIAGGLSYTFGVIFYVMKKIKYTHGIWHLFVLGGTVCHFFAVYYYVIPSF